MLILELKQLLKEFYSEDITVGHIFLGILLAPFYIIYKVIYYGYKLIRFLIKTITKVLIMVYKGLRFVFSIKVVKRA